MLEFAGAADEVEAVAVGDSVTDVIEAPLVGVTMAAVLLVVDVGLLDEGAEADVADDVGCGSDDCDVSGLGSGEAADVLPGRADGREVGDGCDVLVAVLDGAGTGALATGVAQPTIG